MPKSIIGADLALSSRSRLVVKSVSPDALATHQTMAYEMVKFLR